MKASIAELAKLPGVWRGGELEQVVHPVHATGYAALDAQLPGGGWPTGTLSEVLHDGVGIGEVSFLAGALARACEGERLIAWINAPYLPYAPALAQRGIPLERCMVVRPANREDALWAAEQSLRSGACGAVMLWIPEGKRTDDYAWLRRLQMAAESGRAMAVFFRPTSAEKLSTPAHLRVRLSREDGALQVRIPKRRGPPLESPVALRIGFAPRVKEMSPRKTHVPVPAERSRVLQFVSR